MNVYIVELGSYTDRHVAGVYSTPEKAMDACRACRACGRERKQS